MTKTPHEIGREWEEQLADLVGAKRDKRSGAGLYKLDAGGNTLVWSCKATTDKSIRIDHTMMQELREATTGLGGIGASVTPLIAARFEPAHLVGVVDLMDLIALLRQNPEGIIPADKDAQRRSAASKPGMFR